MVQDTRLTLCIDLGKTRCRLAALTADGTVASAERAGAAGAASHGGAAEIARVVADLVDQLRLPDGQAPVAVGVGAAGALTDPAAAGEIAEALVAGLHLPVAVTSDAITAHVGALGGAAGVTLVAGTGAVALGLSPDGALRRVDGWGPQLGDLGGGSWLGREGIRAVLGAVSGLRPVTSLSLDLPAVIAPESDPARWVSASSNPGQQLARFAPAVLRRAEAGDAVALAIAERAVAHLADAARAAVDPIDPAGHVCMLGGLTQSPWFAARLAAALRARGLTPTDPAGTALDGARAVALRRDLPHERYIHRAQ
ncbi:N-acetylglucosamine kinase [Georgenia yuyongxinii]|uniref:ATPase n=1 Tax=Georgenia yuyongxinii TaxID=2589797 RepID=A0A552WN74_9MICO|nr:BadF/BadG/BcrA/BcrD ATPase family protein [Georgenia yuyongxinii]TRW44190.1 ATPase [Georgenia yuyongxinii]